MTTQRAVREYSQQLYFNCQKLEGKKNVLQLVNGIKVVVHP